MPTRSCRRYRVVMVDLPIESVADPAPDPDNATDRDQSSWVTPARLAVLGIALMFLAGVVGYRVGLPDRPGAGSADVGFLQDMIVHHQQAVSMSFRTAEAATDPVVRSFAKEIISVQGYEIGLMEAWLNGWGYPREGGPTAMRWAGMAHPKLAMPGMATEQEIEALDAANGQDVDNRFLSLMTAHHNGGVAMAQSYLDRGDNERIRGLAGRIIKNQRLEISEMQFVRSRLGLPPAPVDAPSGDQQPSGSATSTTTAHHR